MSRQGETAEVALGREPTTPLLPGQGEFDPADADRMLPAITLDRIG